MWLFTPVGFFSIVCDPDKDRLVVRARVKQDLADLKARYLPELTRITTTRHCDYGFRGYAPHQAVATAVARITLEITYTNFKSTVFRTQGAARERTYEKVWSLMTTLQPFEPYSIPGPHTRLDATTEAQLRLEYPELFLPTKKETPQ